VRYAVDVAGETVEVDVRQGPSGPEVSIQGGDWLPARLVGSPAPLYTLELGDARQRLVLGPDVTHPGSFRVALEGGVPLSATPVDERTLSASRARGAAKAKGPQLVRSAMPGVIREVRVAPGDAVSAGQVLLILEAMKMQNEITAPADAVVAAVPAQAGASVAAGAPLVEFAPPEAASED
jgi:biotin carboxyl carrier protein